MRIPDYLFRTAGFSMGGEIIPFGVIIESICSIICQAVYSGFCAWSVKKFFKTSLSSREISINLTPVW